MDHPSSMPDREFEPPAPKSPPGPSARWGPSAIFNSLRTQLISGLIFALPIVITFWIIYWIFMTLERFLLNPVADVINRIQAWMRDASAFQEHQAARLVVQHRVTRAGHVAHAGDSLLHGTILQVVGVPNSRLVATPRADRRHYLQGRPQRGQFAGCPAPRRCRFQTRRAGPVPASRVPVRSPLSPTRCKTSPPAGPF